MNIRPDTALYQVLSELLGRPAPTAAPASGATPPVAKKASVAAAPAGPGTPASGPGAIKPRGSIINIIA